MVLGLALPLVLLFHLSLLPLLLFFHLPPPPLLLSLLLFVRALGSPAPLWGPSKASSLFSLCISLYFPAPEGVERCPFSRSSSCWSPLGPRRSGSPAGGLPARSPREGDAPVSGSSWGPDRQPRSRPPGLRDEGPLDTLHVGPAALLRQPGEAVLGLARPCLLATPKVLSEFSVNEAIVPTVKVWWAPWITTKPCVASSLYSAFCTGAGAAQTFLFAERVNFLPAVVDSVLRGKGRNVILSAVLLKNLEVAEGNSQQRVLVGIHSEYPSIEEGSRLTSDRCPGRPADEGAHQRPRSSIRASS